MLLLKKITLIIIRYIVARLVILGLIFSLILAVLWLMWDFKNFLQTPIQITDKDDGIILIQQGQSISDITQELHNKKIINAPLSFELYARFSLQARKIKAGQYQLTSKMTPQKILDLFVSGKSIQYKFAIIEGWTFKQLRQQIESNNSLTQSLKGLSDQEIMIKIGYPEVFPEGRFLPDTYIFPLGYRDIDLLKRSFDAMNKVVAQAWSTRVNNLPLQNALELLTLASIIEKETALASERPLIAGVFTNRLKKNMRLQTDPTVIYGLGENYKGNITKAHLTTDTPYNTYTRNGLPPTAIAMPSKEAIFAAASPSITDAIYFVAKGDGSGAHIFSKTLAEHNIAVDKYLQSRNIK